MPFTFATVGLHLDALSAAGTGQAHPAQSRDGLYLRRNQYQTNEIDEASAPGHPSHTHPERRIPFAQVQGAH